ncbi:TadE/TadG family type IV pilus assembly protein [Streptomonospora wellingtoniae]|uniref:TadE/TadG family type IV pilus assembly protein n=1 Tax=Streptomonospora wellingtoniae TaxID=3075544 RepID=A0ABU2KWE4_9ACTN|nr:TadE/TadG family type IV pilus assembly protein [Streptomonospora sp. DSM 45055]MDT0303621.1 TadE/TadG family type IV pilus assembly protein [Streptomonospora sp. DSM 45055]
MCLLNGRRGAADDRGSVELAIATPLMMLLVLLVLQAAVWAHGDHVAGSVARRAVEAARAVQGDGAQAEAEAAADSLGGSLLSHRSIAIERGPENVRVVVEAEVPSLIPGISWPVRHELTAPTERFVEPEGGGAPGAADTGGGPL